MLAVSLRSSSTELHMFLTQDTISTVGLYDMLQSATATIKSVGQMYTMEGELSVRVFSIRWCEQHSLAVSAKDSWSPHRNSEFRISG